MKRVAATADDSQRVKRRLGDGRAAMYLTLPLDVLCTKVVPLLDPVDVYRLAVTCRHMLRLLPMPQVRIYAADWFRRTQRVSPDGKPLAWPDRVDLMHAVWAQLSRSRLGEEWWLDASFPTRHSPGQAHTVAEPMCSLRKLWDSPVVSWQAHMYLHHNVQISQHSIDGFLWDGADAVSQQLADASVRAKLVRIHRQLNCRDLELLRRIAVLIPKFRFCQESDHYLDEPIQIVDLFSSEWPEMAELVASDTIQLLYDDDATAEHGSSINPFSEEHLATFRRTAQTLRSCWLRPMEVVDIFASTPAHKRQWIRGLVATFLESDLASQVPLFLTGPMRPSDLAWQNAGMDSLLDEYNASSHRGRGIPPVLAISKVHFNPSKWEICLRNAIQNAAILPTWCSHLGELPMVFSASSVPCANLTPLEYICRVLDEAETKRKEFLRGICRHVCGTKLNH